MNWGSAGLSSARKGFLLTDALAAVFVVFLLCGIVSAVLTGYLNTQQTIRQAAEKIEKEAMQAFAEGEKQCRVCTEEPQENPETEEGEDSSF